MSRDLPEPRAKLSPGRPKADRNPWNAPPMRLKPVLKSSAACLLAATPFTGSALAQPIVLEDIVISANRAESEATRTGADVSVVTESGR